MRLLHIRALQSSHDGRPQVHALDDTDQSLSNGVTSDDTAKDVDEDGCDFGVAGDEVEGLFDGLRSGSSANVEEVGGLAAVELDDVHCGHGETSPVDLGMFSVECDSWVEKGELTQTSNVPVKLDEV